MMVLVTISTTIVLSRPLFACFRWLSNFFNTFTLKCCLKGTKINKKRPGLAHYYWITTIRWKVAISI